MENRLIFKSRGGSPETSSETVGFNNDGRKEYLKIAAMIDKVGETDVKDPAKFNEIVDRIASLYKNLKESPGGLQSAYDGGNFFRELFITLRDKFQLEEVLKRQDFRFKDAMLVAWLADPEGSLDSLIQARPGKWREEQIKVAANYVMSVSNFYAFQDFVASEKYVRDAFTKLHQHYDTSSATDDVFKTMFEYQKDHFELTVEEPSDWIGREGKAKLTETAKQFQEQGKNLTTEADIHDALARLGTVDSSKEVDDILGYAGKFPSYKSDKYSKPIVFLTLMWSFYQGLVTNPSVSDHQRKLVHNMHDEVFKTYPELLAHRKSYFAEQRTETSEAVAESALDDAEAKELKKLSDKIQTREEKLLSKRPKKIHVKPDDFDVSKDGRFAMSSTEYNGLPAASESSDMVVIKIDNAAGGMDLGKLSGSAKELDSGEWKKLFSVNAGSDQKAVTAVLAESGIPQEKIDQIFSLQGQIPEALKPFARIVPSIENGNVTPHLILDRKSLVASLTIEIETILETLDFKPSDLDDPSRIIAEAEKKFGNSLNSLLCQVAPETSGGGLGDVLNFLIKSVVGIGEWTFEDPALKIILGKIILITILVGGIYGLGWKLLVRLILRYPFIFGGFLAKAGLARLTAFLATIRGPVGTRINTFVGNNINTTGRKVAAWIAGLLASGSGLYYLFKGDDKKQTDGGGDKDGGKEQTDGGGSGETPAPAPAPGSEKELEELERKIREEMQGDDFD